jgi:hypothetical protein
MTDILLTLVGWVVLSGLAVFFGYWGWEVLGASDEGYPCGRAGRFMHGLIAFMVVGWITFAILAGVLGQPWAVLAVLGLLVLGLWRAVQSIRQQRVLPDAVPCESCGQALDTRNLLGLGGIGADPIWCYACNIGYTRRSLLAIYGRPPGEKS